MPQPRARLAGPVFVGYHAVVTPLAADRVDACRRASAIAAALLLLALAGRARAEPVALLPPELAAKLVPQTERPLTLAPDGEAVRFQTGPEHWEEGAPPAILDVDRDGVRDYIVMLLVDEASSRRALLVRLWGEAADRFGPTVFYVIIDDADDVLEWAGTARLEAPPPPAR